MWANPYKIPLNCTRDALCKDTLFLPCKISLHVLKSISLDHSQTMNQNIAQGRPDGSEKSGAQPISGVEHPNRVGLIEGERDHPHVEGPLAVTLKEQRRERSLKATKADDTEVPTHLWNERIALNVTPEKLVALDVLRNWFQLRRRR